MRWDPAGGSVWGRGSRATSRAAASLLSLTLAFAAGCSANKKPPPPLQPPAVSPAVSYRGGAPIALPSTRPAVGIAAGDALAVRTTWVALSRSPQEVRPILSDATLIAAPRSADPFRAAGQLSRGAGVVSAGEIDAFLANMDQGKFGQRATIATSHAALPRGVTSTFALADDSRQIEIDLYRPTAATATTATKTSPNTPTATAAPTTLPSDAIEVSLALDDANAKRERVMIDPRSMPPPARFAVVLPVTFSTPRVKAIVAIIELNPPSDAPEHLQAVAECTTQLQRLAAAPIAAATQPDRANAWAGLATALRAMDQPAKARVAMVYLAGQTGAELFGDTALVAPDAALTELAAHIRERIGDKPGVMEPTQLAWILDVATLEQLATMQAAEKLPPELSGVLSRHAGEAARNSGSLEELSRVKGRDQLAARIIAENFTYLEDASPAAHVRAYEWLQVRGRAAAKYDPLGTPRERSAAIDAALSQPADAKVGPDSASPTTSKSGDLP